MEFVKFSTKVASFNLTKGQGSDNNEDLLFVDKAGLDLATNDPSDPAHDSIEEVLLHLALCHSIVIDKRTDKMNSASPDELALVEGAAKQGFVFQGKDGDGVISILRKRDNQVLRYELLNTLEFDSTRKRMSVIIRDLKTN